MTEGQERAQNERDQVTEEKSYLASRTAIKAGEAYCEGDVPTAVALYKKAGDYLVECVPLQVKAGERDFIRVLAASNYFKGGHYALALRQIERVKKERLKQEFRPVYSKFKASLKERTGKGYGRQIAGRIKKLAAKREYEHILELLNEHPFALSAADTARLRFHFANLAGLLSPEEIAGQMGADLTPESEAAKEVVEAIDDDRFKPPPGMRRSVVTGNLEPDPDYKPEDSQAPGPEEPAAGDVLRKTLFG